MAVLKLLNFLPSAENKQLGLLKRVDFNSVNSAKVNKMYSILKL